MFQVETRVVSLNHRFSKWGPQTPRGWKNWCLGSVNWQKIEDIQSDEQFENMSALNPGILSWVWQTRVKCSSRKNLREHASASLQLFSSFISLWDLLKGARAVVHDSHRFCKGGGFGSSRPDVSVRWRNHADPTLWLEGVLRQVPVKSWNSLSACFYGLVSNIQKEKFFTPTIFLWVIQFRHIWHLRYIWSTYFSSKIVWY